MADLALTDIRKRFGGVVALDGAALECNQGEVHGLVGQNGAGKSTLVKILAGVVRRDAGDVRLFGRPIQVDTPAAAIQAGIGMVFQELSLIPDLTVAANVFYGFEKLDALRGISPAALRRETLALFDRMGVQRIDPMAEVRDLPLAQRQMIEIAKVLARDPKVVIFDEATSALGRQDAGWLLDYARTLAAEGRIIIYISHNLREIRQASDRVTVFRNGKDVGVCDTATTSADQLVDLILGRQAGRLYPPREVPIGDEVVMQVRDLRGGARLHGISFQLRRGELLGIGGLTGQGQDDLFRGLFGMLRVSGDVTVGGRTVRVTNPQTALSHGIQLALVPEDRATQGLVQPMSVAENLSMAVLPRLLKFGLISGTRERSLVGDMVRRLSIKVGDTGEPVMRLSGGNQQKVVLGKLLAARPRILLLNDCTRGVDVGTKAEIFQLLRDLTANGSSIVFYSTDADELINMADRVLVMRQGRVEAELMGATQTEENMVRASMGEPIREALDVLPTSGGDK
jgi:ribose transport system ATP-binding protein